MQRPSYSRAIEERTYVNRAVDDAHVWLVDHAQGIEDEQGVPIPVDFYTLNRMRAVKSRYGDWQARSMGMGDGSEKSTAGWRDYFTPTDDDRRMIEQYDALMMLYANREADEPDDFNVGGLYLAVCIIATAVFTAIGYGLWRWLN